MRPGDRGHLADNRSLFPLDGEELRSEGVCDMSKATFDTSLKQSVLKQD